MLDLKPCTPKSHEDASSVNAMARPRHGNKFCYASHLSLSAEQSAFKIKLHSDVRYEDPQLTVTEMKVQEGSLTLALERQLHQKQLTPATWCNIHDRVCGRTKQRLDSKARVPNKSPRERKQPASMLQTACYRQHAPIFHGFKAHKGPWPCSLRHMQCHSFPTQY